MMSLWPFPPKTVEAQFDEKWAFVGKKRNHCDDNVPDDCRQGDNWDHVAYDPEHRLVISVIAGKRTAKNIEKLVFDFKRHILTLSVALQVKMCRLKTGIIGLLRGKVGVT